MLVVAAIEEYGLLGRAVAPVGGRIVQRRVTRPGMLEAGRDVHRVGNELGLLSVKKSESEARTRI